MNKTQRQGAIITGGNRGIGAGIVRRLVADGYDVVFSHLGQPELTSEVIASCPEGRVFSVDVDFRQADAAAELAERAFELLPRVDALVNNAGRGYSERIQDLEIDDIDAVYAINFRGPILMVKEVAQRWITIEQPGAIVNIGSVRGLRSDPVDAIYGGLKAGIHRATESLALEYSQFGIRVNAVAPGTIAVYDFPEMAARYNQLGEDIPLRRSGTPADIAAAVAFLLSDDASYITGVTLPVDGGLPLPITYGGDDIGQGNRWGAIQTQRRTSPFNREPGFYQNPNPAEAETSSREYLLKMMFQQSQ